MATCERIVLLLQAYLDDELAPWERLMVEHHVQDCVICQEELREITSCSAALFESFAAHKLSAGFRDRVMSRLSGRMDGAFWARRARDGSRRVNRSAELASRSMLAGAVVVLVLALVIIVGNYPEHVAAPDEIGMVMGVEGSVESSLKETVVRDRIFTGDRFTTGKNGRLILALEGPTEIKVNGDTELWVDKKRFVRLVKGEIWGDVAKKKGPFVVETQYGNVRVTGTQFNISTTGDQTIVAVSEGKLFLETPRGFTEVNAGYLSRAKAGSAPEQARKIPAADIGRWASKLVPQTTDSRYSMSDRSEGQVVATYLFRPTGETRVMDVLIRRDTYGTAPLSLPGTGRVVLLNSRLEEMADRRLSLSEFTGTSDRVVVDFSSDNIVMNEPFYVLFSPDEVVGSLRVRQDVFDVVKYTSEEDR
jgi:anti-sigma factor RsiW